ncbi:MULTISPECIES: TIGR01244 family sulfur transferase [unclassified Duganella]|uniref:TIGR01244 family sulfur transferase n=1 Tax=unclassified Duganella TaxID=2636909 RepID=UPI000E346B80|nr:MULTISPECIES: TIGR01244 family sulfur transferase [unclassified Duganella]RFP18896.1 TIGR01244 family phosphatase [Duganella sp. BJB475]RFP35559.1 TIGR01244 family phosphatase [Duganella sp. BJB476]
MRTFLFSILAGIGIVLCLAGYFHLKNPRLAPVNKLTQDISVTEQIKQEAIGQFKERGFATIIDLRPDGEAVDQPTSTAMSVAAKADNIKFYYVPVPHGEIPQQSVAQLADALRNAPKPILMYCRSGKRAVRTWSLVEASRAGGMDVNSIMAAVKQGGQSADDLEQDIIRRISERTSISGEKR